MSEGDGLQPALPFPVALLERARRAGVQPLTVQDLDVQIEVYLRFVEGFHPDVAGALRSLIRARDEARRRELDKRRHGSTRPPLDIDRPVREAAAHLDSWAVHGIEARLRQKGFRVGTARVAAAVRRLRPAK